MDEKERTLIAMKMGKEAILGVIDRLRDITVERWDAMYAMVEEHGPEIASDGARSAVRDTMLEGRVRDSHRFAAFVSLVRTLKDFAQEQDDGSRFDAAIVEIAAHSGVQALVEAMEQRVEGRRKIDPPKGDVW